MRILVVGAGVYVNGRGSGGFGTIIPAIGEYARRQGVEALTVVGKSDDGRVATQAAVAAVEQRLAVELPTTFARADAMGTPSRDDFDCAIVSVPDQLHFEVTAPLLRRGLHCLVVKPLTPTLAEARQLCSLQRQAGVYGAVEFHKRFDEANLLVRRMVDEGELGRLSYATVQYSQRREVPLEHFAKWARETDVFQYLGVHYVDLLYHLTGFRPRRAMGCGSRGVLAAEGLEAYDSVHAIVEWERPDAPHDAPFVSQFAVGWIDPNDSSAASDQRYCLVGSAGRVDCDQKHRGVELVAGRGAQSINPYFSQFLSHGEGQRFAGYGPESVQRFLEDVTALGARRTTLEALDATRPTLADALVSTAVIEAVSASLAQEGRWMPVEDATMDDLEPSP